MIETKDMFQHNTSFAVNSFRHVRDRSCWGEGQEKGRTLGNITEGTQTGGEAEGYCMPCARYAASKA